jgi:hypothetical protein
VGAAGWWKVRYERADKTVVFRDCPEAEVGRPQRGLGLSVRSSVIKGRAKCRRVVPGEQSDQRRLAEKRLKKSGAP